LVVSVLLHLVLFFVARPWSRTPKDHRQPVRAAEKTYAIDLAESAQAATKPPASSASGTSATTDLPHRTIEGPVVPIPTANLSDDEPGTSAWAVIQQQTPNEKPGSAELDQERWQNPPDQSVGAGGLQLSGIGETGGGSGLGIPQFVRTIGHGRALGWLGRFNPPPARRNKKTSTNTVSRTLQSVTKASKRLAPAQIQRAIHRRYSRIRMCYHTGLRTNPELSGRVVIHFVIGRDGVVATAGASGDLADRGVVACIGRSVVGLRFPSSPESARVAFPIVLNPNRGI